MPGSGRAPSTASDMTGAFSTIEVDGRSERQTIQGFGYTLTQGSAELLAAMSSAARHRLLEQLYGDGPGALHLSELRLSIGSTDLTRKLYTLDDIAWWKTDPEMRHFSLEPDRATVLPIVHEILAIRPEIHVTAAPWTAPLWMKKPLPGDRYAALYRTDFHHNLLQALWPVAVAGMGGLLVIAVAWGHLRPAKAWGLVVLVLVLFFRLTWYLGPLRGAYPLFHSTVPGGGHIAGLTASTLEDSAQWPRGRWYPGYWTAYVRMFWLDYEDSCVSVWSGLRGMVTDGRDWTSGELRREDYGAYALYLTRYVQAMRAEGVPVESITVQNESEPNENRPSMGWNAEQQNTFVRDYLWPTLQRMKTPVQIIAFDHNAIHTGFPLRMLSDPKTSGMLVGSSFHLYAGQMKNLSGVHDRFPDKDIYFTEQMVIEDTRRGVRWPAAEPEQRIVVGALRNWSRTVMLWNLASDAEAGPHVMGGGCAACLGALTLTGDDVVRNLGYVAMAQVARFVPEGSRVLPSNDTLPEMGNIALRTPDGNTVLLVTNLGAGRDFMVRCGAVRFQAHLEHNAMATYVWPDAPQPVHDAPQPVNDARQPGA